MTNEEAIGFGNMWLEVNEDCKGSSTYTFFELAIKALKQTRWIPVSEKLPKNDEDVLVCYSQGVMEVCYYHIDDTFYPTEYANLNETGWFNKNDDALYFDEPVAWMSLPKSYKAESEDKE